MVCNRKSQEVDWGFEGWAIDRNTVNNRMSEPSPAWSEPILTTVTPPIPRHPSASGSNPEVQARSREFLGRAVCNQKELVGNDRAFVLDPCSFGSPRWMSPTVIVERPPTIAADSNPVTRAPRT